MTIRPVLFIIAGFALLLLCLSVAMLSGQAANDAVRDALASDAGAQDTEQRVTAVCVGFSIGSCNTEQASTTTTQPAATDGNPWPLILLVTAALCPLVFVVALAWARER